MVGPRSLITSSKIDIEASKNEDFNDLKVSDLHNRLKKLHLGGGEKRIAKQHEQGKMIARERIAACRTHDR